MFKFFTGVHMLSIAKKIDDCMISVNILEKRKSDFIAGNWILDSGAFTRITSGKGHMPVEEYAAHVNRWSRCGRLEAAVSQDYMCEPFVIQKTGLSVIEHQKLTTERYRQLLPLTGVYVMPVIQGYTVEDYLSHIDQYGDLLKHGQWAGVGSVCKRNVNASQIQHILASIKNKRPDLRLHGFGLKTTALADEVVRECLYSADSMAWSFAARYNGRDSNSPDEAKRFHEKIQNQHIQRHLFGINHCC